MHARESLALAQAVQATALRGATRFAAMEHRLPMPHRLPWLQVSVMYQAGSSSAPAPSSSSGGSRGQQLKDLKVEAKEALKWVMWLMWPLG